MKILAGTFAVFWSFKGDKTQFHADVRAESPAKAAETFRDMFPEDVIHSIRCHRGRFCTFGA